jgi:hypothetical protein
MMAELQQKHPITKLVPGANITHCITREWPADAIQLCYLQRVAHTTNDGSWDMSLMFYHLRRLPRCVCGRSAACAQRPSGAPLAARATFTVNRLTHPNRTR